METVHYLFDRGNIIIPVHVKEVDVCRAEFLETRFDAKMESLGAITAVKDLLLNAGVAAFKVGGILSQK